MVNLRYFRRKSKLTQKELAEKIGITRQCVSEIERGKRVPSLPVACDISIALGVCIGMLTQCGSCKRKGKQN